MQCKILVALGLLCVSPCATQSEEMKVTVQSIVAKDIWSVANGNHDGKPLVIRFRQDFRLKPDVHAFPKRIKVNWSYRGGESGMPDSVTSEAMGVFEDRLVSAVETDLSAVLVAVITNNNSRVWVYYTSSVPTFSKRLHEIPQEESPYPIDIEAETDPDWRFVFDNILSGTK